MKAAYKIENGIDTTVKIGGIQRRAKKASYMYTHKDPQKKKKKKKANSAGKHTKSRYEPLHTVQVVCLPMKRERKNHCNFFFAKPRREIVDPKGGGGEEEEAHISIPLPPNREKKIVVTSKGGKKMTVI